MTEVIENPELYRVDDLMSIFKIINSRKRKMGVIQQGQYSLIEKIITPLLSELSFESVETFLGIYCTLYHRPSI